MVDIIFSIISLAGGLALFLFGMHTMSAGLEKTAGGKMEQLLRTLTSGKIRGFLLGAGVTAVIQSSTAVTVMLVGLVNAGTLTLSGAIGVVMGSNVGTTITAWILSLSGVHGDSFLLRLLQPSGFAPIIALIGVALTMGKKQRRKDVGTILVGFSVLMTGMTIMSDAVQGIPGLERMLTAFNNPLLGLVAGTLFTALIQSSSASVGVLQALAATGAVTYRSAIPILMGMNIGACLPAMISSIGTARDAKRVAWIHLLFNLLGTAFFLTAWIAGDAIFSFPFADSAVSSLRIAELHTGFKLLSTVLLLPASDLLEKLSGKIVREQEKDAPPSRAALDSRLLTVPAFAVAQAMDATRRMATLARSSVEGAIGLLTTWDDAAADRVEREEQELDKLEDDLGSYLVKLSRPEVSVKEARQISLMLHTISDFERIGDHATNIMSEARNLREGGGFTADAAGELRRLCDALSEILRRTMESFCAGDTERAKSVEPLEQAIDLLIAMLKTRHVNRLQTGECSVEAGVILTNLLTDFERISDHCSNIAVAQIESEMDTFDTHAFLKQRRYTGNPEFEREYQSCLAAYALPEEDAPAEQTRIIGDK